MVELCHMVHSFHGRNICLLHSKTILSDVILKDMGHKYKALWFTLNLLQKHPTDCEYLSFWTIGMFESYTNGELIIHKMD